MSRWRTHARDNTETSIVDALKSAGALVWKIDSPCDIMVQFRGQITLIECKSPRKKLRPSQLKAIQDGWIIYVCFNAEEALKAIGLGS